MKLILIALSSVFMMINACCSKSFVGDDKIIRITEVNCWLNLMPGGKPSFHYSGTFYIDRKFSEEFNFSEVKVFYEDEIIHQSRPMIQISDEIITDSNSVVGFNFYSQQGIKVTESMMKAEKVDFILIFDIAGKNIEKNFREVPITRAY